MSVRTQNEMFKTLKQKMFSGNVPIKRVYAGSKLVYPAEEEDDIYRYRIQLKWAPPIKLYRTGDYLLDTLGTYFIIPKDAVPKIDKIAAMYRYYETTTSDYNFNVFISVQDYVKEYDIYMSNFYGLGDTVLFDYNNTSGTDILLRYKLKSIKVPSTQKTIYTFDISSMGIGINADLPDGTLLTRKYILSPYPEFGEGIHITWFPDYNTAFNFASSA